LRLTGNKIRQLPISLTHVVMLQKLFLGGNRLQELPRSIGALKNLEVLHCGGNQLLSLPDTIGALSKLSMLYLANNQLVELPDSMCELRRLRTLNVHNNALNFLPKDLMDLSLLENVTLRGNPLVTDFLHHLPSGPMSLMELAGRAIKNKHIPYSEKELPQELLDYLDSSRTCTGTNCGGVYFTSKVKSIKVVDFCGKYRVPMMEYLCQQRCTVAEGGAVNMTAAQPTQKLPVSATKMQKVLLSGIFEPAAASE
jgi:hypothetical protein